MSDDSHPERRKYYLVGIGLGWITSGAVTSSLGYYAAVPVAQLAGSLMVAAGGPLSLLGTLFKPKTR